MAGIFFSGTEEKLHKAPKIINNAFSLAGRDSAPEKFERIYNLIHTCARRKLIYKLFSCSDGVHLYRHYTYETIYQRPRCNKSRLYMDDSQKKRILPLLRNFLFSLKSLKVIYIFFKLKVLKTIHKFVN